MKVSELIQSYRTDAASTYGKCRYRTREHYDCLCKRIEADLGDKEIGEIKTRLPRKHLQKPMRDVERYESKICRNT